ncbi:MAG: histidine kinase, partial [bacterium]|nr:histidine kinase [bacterium]
MSFAYLWALATPFILVICRRFPLTTRGWWRNGVFHLLAAIACASLIKLVWDFTALRLVMPHKVPGDLADVAKSLVSTLDYGILNYSLVLLCHNAVDYYRRYEAGRRKTAELEAQLATARLDALRMQLHPHFLFNSLHAISELVHEDPQTAERMIARLSEFLRLTIEHDSNSEVSLRQELDFLERYLEIEKLRFEDRLQIDFQIDPMALGARVPNLILQPLVENALRHGLARRVDGGLLWVRCERENGNLWMRVADNGPGVDAGGSGVEEGVGLGNTRRRLEQLYGAEQRLEVANLDRGGFEVAIRI